MSLDKVDMNLGGTGAGVEAVIIGMKRVEGKGEGGEGALTTGTGGETREGDRGEGGETIPYHHLQDAAGHILHHLVEVVVGLVVGLGLGHETTPVIDGGGFLREVQVEARAAEAGAAPDPLALIVTGAGASLGIGM